jgi:hypothetical protein
MITAALSRPTTGVTWINVFIVVGSAMFAVALAVSAYFEPQWRMLHVLQGLTYVAVILLARMQSPWGFGAGVFTATFWNVLVLFRTPVGPMGIEAVRTLLRNGQFEQPEVWLQLFGALGHFLIIIACLVGFLRLRPNGRECQRFVGGGVLSIAYLLLVAFTLGPPEAAQHIKQALGL